MMQKLSSDSSQKKEKNSGGAWRRRMGCLSVLLFMAFATNAQMVQLANESFKKSLPQGWSVNPASTPTAPTWASDTNVAASGKYAMHGYVPYNSGDTVELVTPFYDCTNYKHVWLKFSQICKVLGSDMCQVMYRENNLSSRWKPIPSDAYEGKSVTYKKALYFNDLSYNEWKSNDTFAVADNTWWREETFDMSDYAGHSSIAFKFVIRKGSYFGSFIADGWYIDDFQLLGSDFTLDPPAASFLTAYSGNVYFNGPFRITAQVYSRSGAPLLPPYLHYTTLIDTVSTNDSIPMALTDSANNLWTATIPQQAYNTRVRYGIHATDSIHQCTTVSDSFKLVYVPSMSVDTVHSVALVSIDKPLKYTKAGMQTVSVTIRNAGTVDLTSVQMGWKINNVQQAPVTWRGNLRTNLQTSFTLGNYTHNAANDTLTVWVSAPNQVLDSVTSDDTLTLIVYTCDSAMAGTYTIGQGGNHDFQCLSDAIVKMGSCGISGDINLLVANGTYMEKLYVSNLDSSVTGGKCIKIASLSAQADSVVICAQSGNVLQLTNVCNMNFENITFTADSDVLHVVQFVGYCQNITFRHCIFNGRKDIIGTDESYATIQSTPNSIKGNICFMANSIRYGTYGVYFNGTGGIVFDSNFVYNFRYAAVDLNKHQENGSSISHNTIILDAADSIYGIDHAVFVRYCSNLLIDGNTIQTKGSTKMTYGLRINNCDSTVLISNNEMILSATYGISTSNVSGTRIIHNSVFLYGMSNSQYGIYASAANNYYMTVRNNISIIDADSSVTIPTYPFYVVNTNNLKACDIDYNTWYSRWGMAYVGKDVLSEEMYRTLVPYASHDCHAHPILMDTTYGSLHFRNNSRIMFCEACTDVPSDKEGRTRFALTGRGCYQLSDSLNLALIKMLFCPERVSMGDKIRPAVILQNSGNNVVKATQIKWEINNVAQTPVKWTGTLLAGESDTVYLGTYVIQNLGVNNIMAFLPSGVDNVVSGDDTLYGTNYACKVLLKGSYTIGDTGDFKNLEEAFAALDECGLTDDPVSLEFLPGTYHINTIIPYVKGADSSHVLGITSHTGNSKDVELRMKSYPADNGLAAPITILGGRYIHIHHLTLTGFVNDTDAAYTCAHALAIKDTASHVRISDCRLRLSDALVGNNVNYNTTGLIQQTDVRFPAPKNNNSDKYAIVYVYGGKTVDYIEVSGNEMDGGVCGFYLEGQATGKRLEKITMEHNVLTNIDYAACSMYFADSCRFMNNRLYQRPKNYSTAGFAVFVDQCKGTDIENNAFQYLSLGTGIILNYAADARIVNNAIQGGNYGIYVGPQSGGRICHNSLYVNTYGFFAGVMPTSVPMALVLGQWRGRFLTGKADICNNVFHVKNGYPVNVMSNILGGMLTFSSNCYYDETNGNTVGTDGLTMDSGSVSVKPVYADITTGLSLLNRADVLCGVLPDIPFDMDGAYRLNPTTMGAYEVMREHDISLSDFVGTEHLRAAGSYPIGVIVNNNGDYPVDSARIFLYLNNTRFSSVLYSPQSPLLGGETDTVWLGNIPVSYGFVNLLAFVEMDLDTIALDDTLRYSTYICQSPLSGVYTLFGKNPDFESIEEMLPIIYHCGLSGPVTIKVRPGSYSTLSFDYGIPGSSDTNTITFVADGGEVVFDGGYSQPGLLLNNVSNMIFKGLTFGNTKDGLMGVQMKRRCDNVVIRACNIYACSTAKASSCRAFSYENGAVSTYLSNVYLIANNIVGGYANISMDAMSGKQDNMTIASIYIDSNRLSEAYHTGADFGEYSSVRSFSYNTVSNRLGTDDLFYGCFSGGYSNFGNIMANRICIVSDTLAYGISFGRFQNLNSASAWMTNNEIRVMGKGVKYGICLDMYGSKWDVHYNSVYARSVNDTAYGIRSLMDITFQLNVTRNMLVTEGSFNYPLWLSSKKYGRYYGLREWNNQYSSTNVGRIVSDDIKTILEFQSITMNDSNSMAVQPAFKDISENLGLKKYDFFACPRLAAVPVDINGAPRSPVTAIGAYGFEIHDNVNLEMLEILFPYSATDVTCIPERTPVCFVFRNSGIQTAHFDSSALKVSLDVTGAITWHWDTLIRSGRLASGRMDTLTLGSLSTLASGTYHIKVSLKDSVDFYLDDDTLSTDYTLNWVNLPYDVGFTATPAELLSVSPSGSAGWKVVSGTGTAPAVAPVFGTGRLEFAGAGNPGASANAVFNAVSLKGCLNPTLSFWYAHDADDSKRDLMFVLATTDGGASYTEIGRITTAAATTGWKQYDIDLSRFANEPCLSIVFQAISFGGANQSLDRIRISADADAALTLLPVDFSTFTACENDSVPLKVVVSNITAMPVEYSSDTVTAEVTGTTTQSFSYVYNKQLGGYETDTVTLGNMDLRANGNYYVNVYMQSQDDNALNDTVSDSTLYIWQDLAIDSIIGIDAQTQHLGGDTVYVSALVRNNCNMAVDRFTVTMELNGETVVTDTVLRHMEAGDSIVHAVSMPYVVPFGTKEQPYYFLELSANIPCDGDANNDRRSVVGVIAVPDTVDLQVLSIAQPATDSGRVKVSPKVTVANIGNAEVQNVMLHVDVLDSAMTLLETVSEYINFINTNDTLEYAFSLTYTVPNYDGSYYLKAYADTYANEINTANDTLTAKFACIRNTTGIANHTATNWSVGQNEPNPANATTVIPFVIPEDAEVALTIMGVNGQLLHRENVAATAGANRVTLHTGTLPSGLYYYGVEYKGQRIVRKMNVVR